MKKSLVVTSFFQTFISVFIIVTLLSVTEAQVRSSNNYQLQSDSINIGGGLSGSASYSQESTVGEIATGLSDSTTYSLRAGYQQMQEIFISLSNTGDVDMGELPGLTGGTVNGSTTFTVITDNPAGYQLTIEAENNPAMQRDGGGATIADYDAGTDPDFSFIVGSNDAHLGFSPKGVDVVQKFLNDIDSNCNQGSLQAVDACWDGLSTTPILVAEAGNFNHPTGATTTIHFKIGIGSTANVLSGVYTATTTVTALPL